MATSVNQSQTATTDNQSAALPAGGNQGTPADDLDGVLAQIDAEYRQAQTPAAPARPAPRPAAQAAPDLNVLHERLAAMETERTTADINTAVEALNNDLDGLGLTKRAIRGMLNDLALEDPRINQAFQNRRTNPAAWEKVLKAAGQKFKAELGAPVDRNATESRAAMAAAVRGAGRQTHAGDADAPNFGNMSDAEFAEWKRKNM